MWNTDFQKQLDASARYLFGETGEVVRGASIEEASGRYSPSKGLKVLQCFEDINGEWVPNPVRSQ